jgi:hypothetical protein
MDLEYDTYHNVERARFWIFGSGSMVQIVRRVPIAVEVAWQESRDIGDCARYGLLCLYYYVIAVCRSIV